METTEILLLYEQQHLKIFGYDGLNWLLGAWSAWVMDRQEQMRKKRSGTSLIPTDLICNAEVELS